MIGNHVAATLRHLAGERLFAVVSMLGLSIGLAAALLAALVIRNQLTWNHFIEGHERVYAVLSVVTPPGRPTIHMTNTSSFIGPQLKLRFPELESVARLALQPATLATDLLSVREQIYWADPNAFDVLPMPVVAGDPRAALRRPDSLVMTRSMARKYFGEDAPLGRVLQMDGHPMRVDAVIEDLPANATTLRSGIFAPALAPWSWLAAMDANPAQVPGAQVGFGTDTFLRLKAGASPLRLQDAAPRLAGELFAAPPPGWTVQMPLVRLDRLNTHPGLNPPFAGKLAALAIMGSVILVIAAVNFVNLMTARGSRRSLEVAIRRIAGAPRRVLVMQFLGETLLYVLLSALVAVMLVEWGLPRTNAFLDTGATFRYWRDPQLLGAMALAVLALTALIGTWPAFTLTAIRPLAALKGTATGRQGDIVRQGLVVAQFAILIALIVAAGVVHAQRRFATSEALRLDTDQMLVLRAPCKPALFAELQKLPGVEALGCSAGGLLNEASFMTAPDREGVPQFMLYVPMQPEVFGLYGIQQLAGRLARGGTGTKNPPAFVINETAARRLGFAQPADALGFTLPSLGRGATPTLEVVGVVPDFSLGSVRQKIEAIGYLTASADADFSAIHLRLSGRDIPETLAGVDHLWKQLGDDRPVNRYFVDEFLQRQYLSLTREAQAFTAFSLVAMLLGALGLLGLAASVASRRTREIGIRKALGAGRTEITRLLLWGFTRPVLWANLIAWPVTAWLMQRWLRGYAYHVELPLWLFPLAGLIAMLVALATVAGQSLRLAGTRPVAVLRDE